MSTEVTTTRRHEVAAPMDEQLPALLQLAVEKDLDVEKLGKLIELQERVMDRQARTAFFEAMAAFRDECPPIQKTRENSQFEVTRNGVRRKAKYAALEEIDAIARPIATKHGLTWTWDTRVDETLMHVSCRVIHVSGHAETTGVSIPFESKAGSSPQQKYGSAQTYGMRYSLVAALGITAVDEDDDGNGSHVEKVTREQAADLESLADEVKVNKPKFLEWLGVDSFASIAKADLQRAKAALEAKR